MPLRSRTTLQALLVIWHFEKYDFTFMPSTNLDHKEKNVSVEHKIYLPFLLFQLMHTFTHFKNTNSH